MNSFTSHVLGPSLTVASGEYGLSVTAAQPIPTGQRLVHVPAALAITADRALRSPTLAALLSRDTEAHISIAAWLMLHTTDEPSVPPMAVPHDSPLLGEYLRGLADADIDCTLLWTEEQLAALQHSRAASKALMLQAWSVETWDKLSTHPESPWRRNLPGRNTTRDLHRFRWALCAVWSRSFQLGCEDATCGGAAGATTGGVWRVLAPGADLLNHNAGNATAGLDVRAHDGRPELWHRAGGSDSSGDSDSDSSSDGAGSSSSSKEEDAAAAAALLAVSFDADSDAEAFNIRATRDIEPGTEITLDYGPRANAELLTTHGFALSENRAAESIPLSLSPSPDDEAGSVKAMILREGNISAPYALSPSALTSDSDLVLALRIQFGLPSELSGSKWKEAFKGQPLSARNERKWRAALRGIVEGMLNDHEGETTAEEDRALLDELGGGRLTLERRRLRAAIITRLGEKEMLREVLSTLEDLRAQAAAHGSQAASKSEL